MVFDSKLVMRAAVVGTAAQLAFAVAQHLVPWLGGDLALFARMMLSASAGYLYGLVLGRGYTPAAVGGAIAGGLSVVPAQAMLVLLADIDSRALTVGTVIAAGTGAVGGLFGQMGAVLKKLGS